MSTIPRAESFLTQIPVVRTFYNAVTSDAYSKYSFLMHLIPIASGFQRIFDSSCYRKDLRNKVNTLTQQNKAKEADDLLDQMEHKVNLFEYKRVIPHLILDSIRVAATVSLALHFIEGSISSVMLNVAKIDAVVSSVNFINNGFINPIKQKLI